MCLMLRKIITEKFLIKINCLHDKHLHSSHVKDYVKVTLCPSNSNIMASLHDPSINNKTLYPSLYLEKAY